MPVLERGIDVTRQNSLWLFRAMGCTLTALGVFMIVGAAIFSDPRAATWVLAGGSLYVPGMLTVLALAGWRHPAMPGSQPPGDAVGLPPPRGTDVTIQRSPRLVRFVGWTLVVLGGLMIAGPGTSSDPGAPPWFLAGLGIYLPGMLMIFAVDGRQHQATRMG